MNNTSCFKSIFSGLIALSIILLPFSAWASSPGETVVATIDKGLSILNDPSLQAPEYYPQRREQLWQVLAPVFDFEEISKRVLGRYWLEQSEKEKDAFVSIFTEILKNSYLGETDSYQGEKIVYVREIIKGNRGKVQTQFFTVEGKKFIVDFSMLNKNGEWTIYDATVEGVSLVSTYRKQFQNILSKEDFPELIDKLHQKFNDMNNARSQSNEESS